MKPARHALVPLPRERAGASFEEGLRARAEARAFLVGMQRAALHAADDAFAGGPHLQAMRVIMVLPGAAAAPRPARTERQRLALQVLPGTHPPAGLRALGGELLRDAYGRLYERDTGSLRALGSVVAGADGRLYERLDDAPGQRAAHRPSDDDQDDVVDLAPHEPASPLDHGSFAPPPIEPRDETAEDGRDEASPARGTASTPPRRHASRTSRTAPCPVRALLPAPGKWVQLRYGDFATLLGPQLAAPERIGADYEIGAYLQVFDSARAIAPEEAARWVFGDEGQALPFGSWNTELAQRLGVALGSRDGRRAAAESPQAGGIGAGRRFFALRVASDPTAAIGTSAPAGPARAAAAVPGAAAAAPRRSVPPALLCAVPPTRTRDQAIAAMQQPPDAAGWWQRLLRASRVSRTARRDWQQRLAGRSLDEQLWGVAPPLHGLGDAALREWVQRTLRLAGYELPRMADEWEIFWRCRGAAD